MFTLRIKDASFTVRSRIQIKLSRFLLVFIITLPGITPGFMGLQQVFAVTTDKNPPQDKSFFSRFNLNGYIKNETAYRFDEPRSITKIRNIAFLGVQYPFSPTVKFTGTGWAYFDLAYNLFDYETIAARFVRDRDQPQVFVKNLQQRKDSPVADIREFYLDISTDKLDMRLGKQFVVWGVLEGIRITDEINPVDFRELIMPDLLDYRIPLWTVKLDYFADNSSSQFLWIPDIQSHKPAPAGSEWELLQRVPGTVSPDSFTLRDSEVGYRFSKNIFDTDVTLSYFYTWDDFPVVFRKIQVNTNVDPVFFPTFTRMNMLGSTFVKQLSDVVLKGEFAYVPDKFFGIGNATDRNNDGFLDNDGELRKQHLRWGLGVDFNRWGTDISTVFSQQVILDYDPAIIQDQFDSSFALFVRKPMPQRSAVFQMLMITLINMRETYLNPKISFDVTNHFQVATGINLFYGQQSRFGVSTSGPASVSGVNALSQTAQFFGNFHDNDRVYMEFKYSF